MYKVKSITKRPNLNNEYKLVLSSNDGGCDNNVYISGDSEVTLASRWPKDVKDFNMDKHVFKTVKDLQVGDEVITY